MAMAQATQVLRARIGASLPFKTSCEAPKCTTTHNKMFPSIRRDLPQSAKCQFSQGKRGKYKQQQREPIRIGPVKIQKHQRQCGRSKQAPRG